MKNYILFNPLAGNGKGKKCIDTFQLEKTEAIFLDITEISDYKTFFENLQPEDKIIICGGDGTLNHFINDVDGIEFENEVFYIAAGSGNDFLNDLDMKINDCPIKITNFIKNLPKIHVKNKVYRFLNGIGYGIDGYCCEERDKKQNLNKSVNYTLIALKGLLYDFKPRSATVNVDGKEYKYERVWMAPTMLGRFFGGGMMVAPTQERKNPDESLSLVVAHDLSKLRILCLFLSIFKGNHIKHTKYVTVHTGHKITVTFDKPTALQIDGETVLDVPFYTVMSNKVSQPSLTDK